MTTRYFIPLTLLFLLTVAAPLAAQNARLHRAAEAMRDLDYVTAIADYQQILQLDDSPEARMNLAECYRKINDTENAEYWYAQVVGLPQARPPHWLYYGMMLQANGKCDLAKEWYARYAQAAPDDVRGQNLARACEYATELLTKNADVFAVSHLPFNSNRDDYSPALGGDSIVIFASDRDDGNAAVERVNMWTGAAFTSLYSVRFQQVGTDAGGFRYGRATKYERGIESKFHEAALAFSADGQTIFFTRTNYLNGKANESEDGLKKLKIYYGTADGQGGWTNLQSLPFNSDEYSVMHPALSPDGQRLYFASNMPNGFGGMDLYYSNRSQGRWGPPVNLGPSVNTEGNEAFPCVDKTGRVYFASDSHVGLGGLDIYYTLPQGDNAWSAPVNLGFPINSTYDDFGLVSGPDLAWGFFASDRPGGVGRDDVYGFRRISAPVEILVFDAQTKQPIADATVLNSLTPNATGLTTGANGLVSLDMRLDQCADFSAAKPGYAPGIRQGCTKNLVTGQTVRVEIPLQKQVDYTLQGIVFDMREGLPAEAARVELTNDCGRPVSQPFFTNADGRFRFRVEGNCCYTLKAVREGFTAGLAEGLCTQGLTPGATLSADLNLQPQVVDVSRQVREGMKTPARPSPVRRENVPLRFNERTGLYETADGEGFSLQIYYALDEVELPADALPQLEKLLQLLRDNPDFKGEISSHTDARGSDEYNLELSQRRAEVVVNWLVSRGISRDRLVARGYGESRPVVPCINCSEAEWQQNRRTEFRIFGADGTKG